MIWRCKNFAKSILPNPIVRKLKLLMKFRFPSGRPNAALISIVLAKNILAALLNFRSVWASNRAIKLYRANLKHLASLDTGQNVKLLHLI